MGALLLVPAARWFLEDIDHQYSNIATAALTAIGFLSFTVGILRRLPRSATFIYLLGVVASIAIFFFCYEFRGFTGELVPTFRWRFSASSAEDKTPSDPKLNGNLARLSLGWRKLALHSSSATNEMALSNPPRSTWTGAIESPKYFGAFPWERVGLV